MPSTREVLTFQFGNYSNYIGAHWWNIQESGFNYDPTSESTEINNDVLYREGKNHQRQTTFTPRLLLVDLDESLKHLSKDGNLYREMPEKPNVNPIEHHKKQLAWKESEIQVVRSEEIKKNQFQMDLDNPEVDIEEKEYDFSKSVDTWADYMYTRYHPRTITIIKEYKHSPANETFDTFSNGSEMWKSELFSDEFSDKIRQYLEECDHCQGFQTMFDCHNAHSGLALQCMEHVNEEYSKANLAIPVFTPRSVLFQNADDILSDSIRVVNIALTYSRLTEHCSMFVPLSTQSRVWRDLGEARPIPLIKYQSDNLYQTSSILASFLETISLQYRIRNAPHTSTLGGLCADLTNYGRKLTAAAIALPFQMASSVDLIDCLDKFEGNIFTQLTPNCKIGSDYVIQSLCVRGIPKDRLKRPLDKAQQQMKMAAYKCNSVSEMFQLYLQCQNHASLAHVTSVNEPMLTKLPFPREMFDSRINIKGFTDDKERASEEKVNSVPTIASVQCSGDISETVESLHRQAKRVKVAQLHRFLETGLEQDDYADTLESLLQFKDRYEDNYEL